MRAVPLLLLVACGDNIHPGQPQTVDAQQLADAKAQTIDAPIDSNCSDQVAAVKPMNPGSDASDYPAAGWWTDDTRANGMVALDDAHGVPASFGCHAARFITGAATGTPLQDKAQLLSFALAGTALSTINNISYWAYRASTSTGGPAIDLALNVMITGASVPGNYASLTYEPYNQAAGQNAIVDDTWQQWNATATTAGDGLWWTTKIANPNPGSQAKPIPWATFQAMYPDALVHGYGFNVGSNNPNMDLSGDGLVFGTTTTDF